MATFVCKLGLPDGAVAVRTIEAPDESAVRAEVSRLNARLFSLTAAKGGAAAIVPGAAALQNPLRRRARPVRPAEFLVFNQELVALLKAGLPIVTGFEVLLERQENQRF